MWVMFAVLAIYLLVDFWRRVFPEKPSEVDPRIWDADPLVRRQNYQDALALRREGLTFQQASLSKDPKIRERAWVRFKAEFGRWKHLPAAPPRSPPPQPCPRRRVTPRERLLGYRDPPGR